MRVINFKYVFPYNVLSMEKKEGKVKCIRIINISKKNFS